VRSHLAWSIGLVPAPTFAAVLGFVMLCMASDLRTRRIPNALTAPTMIVGAVLNVVYGGCSGLAVSVGGLGLAVGILVLPFVAGGIGGGDVKMMGAIGALVGPHRVAQSLAVGIVLGGLVMVGHLARQGRLREKLLAIATMIGAAATDVSVEPLKLSAEGPDAVSLPYSVPLGLGTLAVLVLG